jgi:hypothetical protein
MLFFGTQLVFGQDWNKYAVQFGEHGERIEQANSNTVRVFMDKNGWFYPNSNIKDKELIRLESSLKNWYLDPSGYAKHIDNNASVNDAVAKSKNQEIIDHYVRTINTKLNHYPKVYFLIHGFRKKAYKKKDNSLSTDDYQKAKKYIQRTSEDSILFVEIYWDSKHIKGLKAFRKKRGMRLMEESAIPSALNAGNALRELVHQIDKDTIAMVSHSLGAVFLAEVLFTNQDSSKNKTPQQEMIYAYFVAPAIGSESFMAYNQRTSPIKKDNYQTYIIYNPNDFVLNKKFGAPNWTKFNALPTDYGNTSLGCNYNNDVDSLSDIFKRYFKQYNAPIMVKIDRHENGKTMHCHNAECYFRHTKFLQLLH